MKGSRPSGDGLGLGVSGPKVGAGVVCRGVGAGLDMARPEGLA